VLDNYTLIAYTVLSYKNTTEEPNTMVRTNTCIILHPGTDAEQIAYINDCDPETNTYYVEIEGGEVITGVARESFILFAEVN
jgi:hypothetical protein